MQRKQVFKAMVRPVILYRINKANLYLLSIFSTSWSFLTTNSKSMLTVGGFGGIRPMHCATLGSPSKLSTPLPDLGGTWLTNTYPGALSDTESFNHIFSHGQGRFADLSLELPIILDSLRFLYLRHFAEKHNLRKDMEFNAEMQSAIWDGVWEIKISDRQTLCTLLHYR